VCQEKTAGGNRVLSKNEICNECGRSVKPGSGLFINRVPDFNSPEVRKEMGKKYPEGDFICVECDAKFEDGDDEEVNYFAGVWM